MRFAFCPIEPNDFINITLSRPGSLSSSFLDLSWFQKNSESASLGCITLSLPSTIALILVDSILATEINNGNNWPWLPTK